MNPPNEDFKDLLVAEGSLGLTFKDNLHIGREPSKPNNVVTVFNAPDRGPQLFLDPDSGVNPEDQYEYTAVQVRVRDKSENAAMVMSQNISKKMHNRGNFVLNGALYTLIQALDNPALLDYDENNNARVITNYHIQRTSQPT